MHLRPLKEPQSPGECRSPDADSTPSEIAMMAYGERCYDSRASKLSFTQREVARVLGGDHLGPDGVSAPGPGHSQHDRSLRIWLDASAPDGFRVHSFAGDDPIRCRDHVLKMLGLPPWRPGASASRRPKPHQIADPDAAQEGRIAHARSIWRETVEMRGTVAEAYLNSRGLEFEGDLTHVLRFHGGLHYNGRSVPALVALMRD